MPGALADRAVEEIDPHMLVHPQRVGGAEHHHAGEHVPLGLAERVGVVAVDIEQPADAAAGERGLASDSQQAAEAVAQEGVESGDERGERAPARWRKRRCARLERIDQPAQGEQPLHRPSEWTCAGNLLIEACDCHARSQRRFSLRPRHAAWLAILDGGNRRPLRRAARRVPLLRAHGFATVTELPLASGRRVDVMAINGRGEIWVVEIKSCPADLRADAKWPEYEGYCDRLYFAVPPDMPLEFMPASAGLIVGDQWGAEIVRDCPERILLTAGPAQGGDPALRPRRRAAAPLPPRPAGREPYPEHPSSPA